MTLDHKFDSPVNPNTLVGDEWMNDPVARAEFDRLLQEQDIAMKPYTDAIEASTHLTERDYAVTILPCEPLRSPVTDYLDRN